MPIYEYRCDQGHTFEVMQRISDDPVASCQTCSAPVHRVFHPVAVHFKGSGFYSTDYGSKKRARELNEAAEGTAKSEKDEGKSKSDTASSGSDGAKSDSPAKQTKTDSKAPASKSAD